MQVYALSGYLWVSYVCTAESDQSEHILQLGVLVFLAGLR